MSMEEFPVENAGAAPLAGPRLARFVGILFAEPATLLGFVGLALFVLAALLGPALAPYGFNQSLYESVRVPPSTAHWFGTDHLARDVFSRLLIGARSVLVLAGGGTLVAALLGTLIGLVSGYAGGWLDELLMRFFDSLLSLPALLLALLLLGTLRAAYGESVSAIGRGLGVFTVLAVVYMPIVARVVRSVALSVRNRAYIEAARLQGESTARILFREILPAALPALAVEVALRFSYAIFLTASLGFLGVGVQPPNPDWGLMVNEGRRNLSQVPWAMWFPAAAISLVVVCANLAADGLKRALLAREQAG